MDVYVGVAVFLLSAVNVGSRKAASADLKRLCADLGWNRAETLLASGNLIIDTGRSKPKAAGAKFETAFRERFGFESAVIVRDADALDSVIERLPFEAPEPSRLLVHFMREAPSLDARTAFARFAHEKAAEPHAIDGAELFIRYDNGVAESKLTAQALRRLLMTPGTARNWNTVHKLRDRARAMEGE